MSGLSVVTEEMCSDCGRRKGEAHLGRCMAWARSRATSREWYLLVRIDQFGGSARIACVRADEPITVQEAWDFHRKDMSLNELAKVTEVRAIQVEHMALVTTLNTVVE